MILLGSPFDGLQRAFVGHMASHNAESWCMLALELSKAQHFALGQEDTFKVELFKLLTNMRNVANESQATSEAVYLSEARCIVARLHESEVLRLRFCVEADYSCGGAYAQMGLFDIAKQYYNQSSNFLYNALTRHAQVDLESIYVGALAQSALGKTVRDFGRPDLAPDHFRRALEFLMLLHQVPNVHELFGTIGVIVLGLGEAALSCYQYDLAESCLKLLFANPGVAESFGFNFLAARICGGRGEFSEEWRRLELAKQQLITMGELRRGDALRLCVERIQNRARIGGIEEVRIEVAEFVKLATEFLAVPFLEAGHSPVKLADLICGLIRLTKPLWETGPLEVVQLVEYAVLLYEKERAWQAPAALTFFQHRYSNRIYDTVVDYYLSKGRPYEALACVEGAKARILTERANDSGGTPEEIPMASLHAMCGGSGRKTMTIQYYLKSDGYVVFCVPHWRTGQDSMPSVISIDVPYSFDWWSKLLSPERADMNLDTVMAQIEEYKRNDDRHLHYILPEIDSLMPGDDLDIALPNLELLGRVLGQVFVDPWLTRLIRFLAGEAEEEGDPLLRSNSDPSFTLAEVEDLVLIPSGGLYRFPLQCAISEIGPLRGIALQDRFQISFLPSSSFASVLSDRSSMQTVHGVSPLVMGPAGNDLADGWFEAQNIALWLGVEAITGDAMTIECFLNKSAITDVLCLITHSHFEGCNPEASWIEFARQERLSLQSLSTGLADLSQLRLCILNSCSSARAAVDQSDEMQSLGMAFLIQGGEAVVATLWAVSDACARFFAEKFIKGLKSGLTAGEAFSASIANLRQLSGGEWNSPAYWGAFQLYGNKSITIT